MCRWRGIHTLFIVNLLVLANNLQNMNYYKWTFYNDYIHCHFSIYKKLVTFLNIDETGSNYPKVTALFGVVHSFWLLTLYTDSTWIHDFWRLPFNIGLPNYPLSCAFQGYLFISVISFFLGRKNHWSTWSKSIVFMHKVRFVYKKDENTCLKNFHCKSN